jgi:hypothetical protein
VQSNDRAGALAVKLRQRPAAADGHRGAPHGPGGARAAVPGRGAVAGGALDPSPTSTSSPAGGSGDCRGEVLGALEKCDEDLRLCVGSWRPSAPPISARQRRAQRRLADVISYAATA